MHKIISLLPLLCLFCFIDNVSATNYYVSPSGSNSNNGLSVNTAFQTLNFASNQTVPGDTVFVLNGTYTNPASFSNVLDIYNSGSPSSGIVYMNFEGHSPVIKLNSNNWSGIALQGVDYITIDGFEIIGNNDSITIEYAIAETNNLGNPATSGNGIGITQEYNNDSNKPHHNTIRNCKISKCGGAGIYTYRADYTTIENNVVFECGWFAPYGNSGISLYQCWNSDSLQVIRNSITGNICYRNENYIPFFAVGSITDGNGIIIDDGKNTQNNSTQGVYLGKTYIGNNLIYNNGGRGIHAFLSDNVIVANNTCYQNCQSPAIQDGELTAYFSDSISYVNNIVEASADIPPIDVSEDALEILVSHNLWATNSNLASPFGNNSLLGSPSFVFPNSNPSMADFRLLSSSIAIDAGTSLFAPFEDLIGNTRDENIDLGCYEFQQSLSSSTLSNPTLSVFPNPADETLHLNLNSNSIGSCQIKIFDVQGREVKRFSLGEMDGNFSVDTSTWPNGVYFMEVNSLATQNRTIESFVIKH